MPAPTPSRSAIMPGTRRRRWSSSSARRKLVRPINYPAGTPGRGAALIEAQERRARAGHQRHGPHLHGPARRSVRRGRARACRLRAQAATPTPIIVDIHGEATSEKQAMGHFCDGRASLVVGTHTHAPTADHQILPGGTAFMSDVGMTGDYDFGDRHGQGRAAEAVPAQDLRRALRAGDGAGDVVRGRGRDR